MSANTPPFAVDEDLCVDHGRCYSLAPQAFVADDMGLGRVREHMEGELQRDPEAIADACPEMAIHLTSGSKETES